MWPLIRYQSVNYVKYLFPLALFLVVYFSEFFTEHSAFKVCLFLCFWLFILTTGALTTSEGYEEKNRGYRILSTLPLTTREIVATKFLLLFIAVLALNLAHFVVLQVGTWVAAPNTRPVVFMLGVLWGVFCLIYGGLMYIGIFRMGFSRMTRYHWIFFLALVVAMVFVLGDILGTVTPSSMLSVARSPLWMLAAASVLGVYYLLFRTAVRIKENRGEA